MGFGTSVRKETHLFSTLFRNPVYSTPSACSEPRNPLQTKVASSGHFDGDDLLWRGATTKIRHTLKERGRRLASRSIKELTKYQIPLDQRSGSNKMRNSLGNQSSLRFVSFFCLRIQLTLPLQCIQALEILHYHSPRSQPLNSQGEKYAKRIEMK